MSASITEQNSSTGTETNLITTSRHPDMLQVSDSQTRRITNSHLKVLFVDIAGTLYLTSCSQPFPSGSVEYNRIWSCYVLPGSAIALGLLAGLAWRWTHKPKE